MFNLWLVVIGTSIILAGMIITTYRCGCDINICLNWRIDSNGLTLTCKVNDLRFEIKFYSPANELVAHCYVPSPESHCQKNAIIHQNISTNTTVYIKRSLKDISGKWRCDHGTNIDEATVDVYQISDTYNIPYGMIAVLWAVFPCYIALLIVSLLLMWKRNFSNSTCCQKENDKVSRQSLVAFCLLPIIPFAVPAVIGAVIPKSTDYRYIVLAGLLPGIVIGVIEGFVVWGFIRYPKEKNRRNRDGADQIEECERSIADDNNAENEDTR